MVVEISKQQLSRIKEYQVELEVQNELLRRTREKLESSLDKYTDLYDYSPIGYLTLDEGMTILEANLMVAEMLGVPRLDLAGTRFTSFIPVGERERFLAHLDRLKRSSGSNECEIRLSRGGGQPLDCRLSCLYRLRQGKCFFRVAITDISNLIAIENKLHEEINLRQLFLDALPCAALLIEYDGRRIVAANKEARERGAVAGRTCHAALMGQKRPCSWCLAQEAAPEREENLKYWSGERYLDSYWRWVGDGRLYLRYIFDLTEQQRLKEALERAHEELESRVAERTRELQESHVKLMHAEKLTAVGNLSASIAHEFNNPLQSVMTILQGLKSYASLNPREDKLLDVALQEGARMKNLITSLGDFYRPTTGRVELVDLHALIDGLLLLVKKDFKKRNIAFRREFSSSLPLIHGVTDQLKQVILNLLSNAADACSGGGTISISTAVVGEMVVVAVADTGEGIKPEHLSRLFEPFFSTKSGKKGTGLGLSISYGIVKEHGGHIEVESEPGTGAKFKVSLPIRGLKDAEKGTAGG